MTTCETITPTLPSCFSELNALLGATPVDLNSVAQLIRADSVLAAQVLRMCHTLPYTVPVTRIEDAVVLAGIERLRAVALTSSVIGWHSPQQMRAFWRHSLFTAVLSERVAEWMGYPDPAKAYAAGLLHGVAEMAGEMPHSTRHNIDPPLTDIVDFAGEYSELCGLGLSPSKPNTRQLSTLQAAHLLRRFVPLADADLAWDLALAIQNELQTILVSLAVLR